MSMHSSRPNARAAREDKKDSGPKAKFSQLVPYLKEHTAALWVAVILSLIGAGTSLAQPLVVGQVIDAVTYGQDLTTIIVVLIVITLASAVTSGLMYYLSLIHI